MADFSLADLKARLASPRPNEELSLAETRAALDAASARTRLDPRIAIEPALIGECAAEWLRPAGARSRTAILYLHGGGFVGGSCISHRPLAAGIALASGIDTLVLEYRLAPEHPWPAAEDDAFAAYRELCTQIGRTVLAGDSAGGNLVMTTLLRAKAVGAVLPAACVLMSPWIDLDLKGGDIRALAPVDPTLTAAGLSRYAALYRGGGRGTDILGADLSSLPPILLQVGGDEILRGDGVRLAKAIEAAGGSATLEIGPGLFHVWQAYAPWLKEGRDALARIGAYLNATLQE